MRPTQHVVALRFALPLLVCLAAAPARAGVEDDEYAWPDMGAFVHQLIERIGAPIRVFKIELDSDGNVDLWLQNHDRPDLIDSYEYSDAQVNGPIPVKFEHYPTQETLDYHLIDLDRVDFARLPSMLARARKELRIPDGEVSHIELERSDDAGALGGGNLPVWKLRLSDPRHDGTVAFDLNGKVLSAERD